MSKILIVEDEVAIAELEKDYLELSGFDVVMQHTGDAGLKAALNEDFNLIILDLMLPNVDGFERRSVRRRTHRSSWYLPRRKTLTKSVVWVLVPMTI